MKFKENVLITVDNNLRTSGGFQLDTHKQILK